MCTHTRTHSMVISRAYAVVFERLVRVWNPCDYIRIFLEPI